MKPDGCLTPTERLAAFTTSFSGRRERYVDWALHRNGPTRVFHMCWLNEPIQVMVWAQPPLAWEIIPITKT